MESKKRLLIVSFGDSRKYRFEYIDTPNEDPLKKNYPLMPFEQEIKQYLNEKFPGRTFAYLSTPRVTEVEWSHLDKYQQYPPLDEKAMEEIKQVLTKEVEERADLREMNDNAPFSAIGNANF